MKAALKRWRYAREQRNLFQITAWLGLALAYLAVLALLSGCGGGPDQAACKAALVQQWKTALDGPAPVAPGTEPSACKGLDAATLQKLWYQAGTEASG